MRNKLIEATKALKSVADKMVKNVKCSYSRPSYYNPKQVGYVKFSFNGKYNTIIVTGTSSVKQLEKQARIAIEEIC